MTRTEAAAKVREFLGQIADSRVFDLKTVELDGGMGWCDLNGLREALPVLLDDAEGVPRVEAPKSSTCAACKSPLSYAETASWCVHCNGAQCERCCLSKRSKRAGR